MKKLKKNKLKLLLFVAALVRLSIVYFQYSGDVGNHLAWGREALEGILGFYSKTFLKVNHPNYPPLTIYLFAFSSWAYQAVNQLVISLNQSIKIFPSALVPLMETLNMQSVFLKLPAILADLGTGWLIYQLAPVKKKSHKLLVSGLYLLNPAVIYISTVWGQIESIPIFFVLLSIYFTNQKQFVTLSSFQSKIPYFLSHVFFVMAILSKQTALWLLPILLILWLKDKSLKTFLQGLFLQAIIFILLYLPFTLSLTEPFRLYFQTLTGSSNLVSDAAWNLWYFIYPANTPDSILLLGLPVRFWSILSILFSTVIIALRFYQNKLTLYQSLFWLSLIAFFLQTRVHERHLFPALVFLLLINLKNKQTFYITFLILTFYHMFNLYWSLNLPFI